MAKVSKEQDVKCVLILMCPMACATMPTLRAAKVPMPTLVGSNPTMLQNISTTRQTLQGPKNSAKTEITHEQRRKTLPWYHTQDLEDQESQPSPTRLPQHCEPLQDHNLILGFNSCSRCALLTWKKQTGNDPRRDTTWMQMERGLKRNPSLITSSLNLLHPNSAASSVRPSPSMSSAPPCDCGVFRQRPAP